MARRIKMWQRILLAIPLIPLAYVALICVIPIALGVLAFGWVMDALK